MSSSSDVKKRKKDEKKSKSSEGKKSEDKKSEESKDSTVDLEKGDTKKKNKKEELEVERIRKKPTLKSSLKALFLETWYINILLLCIPVGIGLGASNQNGVAVFVVNFFCYHSTGQDVR